MHFIQLSSGRTFEASEDISLLEAGTNSGVFLPYSCRTGRCNTCKCKVISGETKVFLAELGLSEAEKSDGWILSCARSACSDLVLQAEDLGEILMPKPRTYACRIDSLEKLTPNVIKLVLRLPPSVRFNFIPGQYINIIGDGGIHRSYSLANTPNSTNTLELHIRAVENGVMSKYWFTQSAQNDLLRFHGPLGTFFMRNIAKRDLIFMATGTGLAPVKSMLEALPSLSADQQPQSVTVLWGTRSESDLYFDISSLPGLQKYIPVLSRATSAWTGERGYIQDVLLRQKSDLSNCIIYACGSETMILSAKSSLISAGLPTQHFYSDAFLSSSFTTQ